MPATAAELRLLEPFNPAEALPKSGEYLAQLRNQFGNLGLAAAAYNAGPQRVREFITGLRDLPTETRNYVLAITGRMVDDWVKPANDGENNGEPRADPATCLALLTQAADPFFPKLPQRKVPSWCRSLHHPNVEMCGTVHQVGPTIKTSSLINLRGREPYLRSSR